MSGLRHISECICGWLDEYQEKHVDPFNLPDALRDMAAELAAKQPPPRTPHDPEQTNEDLGETA